VLSTISRRDPRRTKADVWTSGNRIYACDRPDVLRQVIEATVRVSSATEAVEMFIGRELNTTERESIFEAMEQVMILVQTERDEQTRYAQELSNGDSCAA